MHFIRLSLIGLLTFATGAAVTGTGAQAQNAGANRLVSADGNGTWTASSGDLMSPAAVNGFDMLVSGDFGFGAGDELFLLAKDGTNRFIVRTSEGTWATAQNATVGQSSVNGFDMVVAGDFGFGEGDELFLLAKDGTNRFVVRTSEGKWAVAENATIGKTSVNGFDMVVAGDFGFGEGEELFLLAKDGTSRFVVRTSEGKWAVAEKATLGKASVNGFNLVLAGDFGFGEGEELFLLSTEGANRFAFRNPSGAWSTTDDVLSSKAANGYTKAVSGAFGDGPEDSIFLLQ